jgi:hypothetical protein
MAEVQGIQQVYKAPDGKEFGTREEAMQYIRRPLITAELSKIDGVNKDLVEWLLENQESVEVAFEVGTIRRVTKAERKKLEKALEHLVSLNDPKLAFISENAGAVKDSFRWPGVKRMDEAEKREAARRSLVASTEGNEQLADWIVANREAILNSYEAVKPKREVNPAATEALAAYRAKKAAEKAAAEAAKGETPEAEKAK